MGHIAAEQPPDALTNRAQEHLRRWSHGQVISVRGLEELLTVNFHPDRRTLDGTTVLDSIARTGRLQNQFESRLTNGFPLDWSGGLRTRRESALFGGAYDTASPAERPKYGSINLYENPRGGWPRFGSCHWRLAAAVLERCTVTIPGSPTDRAWWGCPVDLDKLLQRSDSGPKAEDGHRFRLIDGPVELQIHGIVELRRDVVGLVLDPSFRGCELETSARRIADEFDVNLEWAPELRGCAAGWRVPAWRRHAGDRVRAAASAGKPITAEWIGRDLWTKRTNQEDQAIVDGAGRYLWNRLLLNQGRRSAGLERALRQLEANRPLPVVNRAARLPDLVTTGAE